MSENFLLYSSNVNYLEFRNHVRKVLTWHMLSSVQSLSRVRLFVTPWIAAHQASLSITISRSSLRLTSIESMMPSSHLILDHPLLLLPPIPPSIRVFSNESTLLMKKVLGKCTFLESRNWIPNEKIVPSCLSTSIYQLSEVAQSRGLELELFQGWSFVIK